MMPESIPRLQFVQPKEPDAAPPASEGQFVVALVIVTPGPVIIWASWVATLLEVTLSWAETLITHKPKNIKTEYFFPIRTVLNNQRIKMRLKT